MVPLDIDGPTVPNLSRLQIILRQFELFPAELDALLSILEEWVLLPSSGLEPTFTDGSLNASSTMLAFSCSLLVYQSIWSTHVFDISNLVVSVLFQGLFSIMFTVPMSSIEKR
jgi:hypothetical protein